MRVSAKTVLPSKGSTTFQGNICWLSSTWALLWNSSLHLQLWLLLSCSSGSAGLSRSSSIPQIFSPRYSENWWVVSWQKPSLPATTWSVGCLARPQLPAQPSYVNFHSVHFQKVHSYLQQKLLFWHHSSKWIFFNSVMTTHHQQQQISSSCVLTDWHVNVNAPHMSCQQTTPPSPNLSRNIENINHWITESKDSRNMAVRSSLVDRVKNLDLYGLLGVEPDAEEKLIIEVGR